MQTGSPQNPTSFAAFWYREPEGEAHAAVEAWFRRAGQHLAGRLQTLLKWWRIYEDRNVSGWGAYQYDRVEPDDLPAMSLNVTAVCVDTVHARITKNEVRPLFVTRGGDWELQQKAKSLQTFSDGWRQEQGVHEKLASAFLSAQLFGSGFAKIYDGAEHVMCEEICADEIRVDAAESKYGRPRTIGHITTIDREQLVDSLDDLSGRDLTDEERARLRSDIEGASLSSEQTVYADSTISSIVTLYEIWRLPSGPDAGDGRHIICVSNATIRDEPMTEMRFPIAKIDWAPPVRGYFGRSLVAAIYPCQMELNRTLAFVQESMHLGGGVKVWVPRDASVDVAKITNTNGGVYTYDGGQPPIFQTTEFLTASTLQLVDRYEKWAYNLARISQLSATGQKPAGIDSGEGLRVMNDLESDGFAPVGRRWEQFNLDVVDLAIDAAKRLAERDKSFAVVYRGKRSTQVVRWRDVDMERDEYQLTAFPTSQLPATPAGKISTANDLNKLGVFTADDIRRIVGIPELDLDEYNEFRDASRTRVLNALTRIANGERPRDTDVPDAFMNLGEALTITRDFYNHAINCDLDDDSLDMIRQYEKKILLLTSPPPAAPPEQMGPAGPAGPDMPQGGAPVDMPPAPAQGAA